MERWYYMLDGEVRGPAAMNKLRVMVKNGVIQNDTAVRPEEGEGDWEPAETISGLFDGPSLASCSVCGGDMASNAPACPHCGAPNKEVEHRKQQAAVRKKMVDHLRKTESGPNAKRLIIIGSLILVALIAGYLLLSTTGIGGAENALAEKLDGWRNGNSYGRPILIDYEIVKGKETKADGSYVFTVNLTFTTPAGGRPVEQELYWVEKDGLMGKWKVDGPHLD